MSANLERAMAITATLNRLTFNDADEVRSLFSDLIGKNVDDSFLLIPPFYTTGGVDISVGRNVFVNQNCTFYDLGGLEIADDSAGAASIRVWREACISEQTYVNAVRTSGFSALCAQPRHEAHMTIAPASRRDFLGLLTRW
jgi:hypothetical protein